MNCALYLYNMSYFFKVAPILVLLSLLQSSQADDVSQFPLMRQEYDVGKMGLKINCTPPVQQGHITYSWSKNGVTVEKVKELSGRYELLGRGEVLHVKGRAHEDDYGEYVCAVREAPVARWTLVGRPVAKLDDNSYVVEGNKLTLTCKVVGKPYPAVRWTYGDNASSAEDVALAMGARVKVSQSASGVPGGQLELSAAERGDAGRFHCVAGDSLASTTLRVKDMYAALWPFLGICAEVLVLCAVILVYERRRTKPELDDSDADTHDQ